MIRKIILLFSLTIALGAIFIFAFSEGYLRFNYPSREEFPIQGIDVSHHQGTIDWDLLKKSGVDFAFIKATEGENFKDPDFLENQKNAQAAGIIVGAYHYFTFCRSGIDQANNFIATVPLDKKNLSLPPVVDLEFGGNCTQIPEKADLLRELHLFQKRIESHFGKLVYYTTKEFYEKYLHEVNPGDESLQNDLWLRDIFRKPRFAKKSWTFWQYANRGRLQGIKGPVDLNVFYGSKEDWEKYITPRR